MVSLHLDDLARRYFTDIVLSDLLRVIVIEFLTTDGIYQHDETGQEVG